MAAKDDLGRRGEDLAAQFLSDAGYTIIDRNWRCPRGEIDLVARDGNDTVFIEVKTRSSTAFGHPFEAITTQKLARLKRLAHAWCDAHRQGIGSAAGGSAEAGSAKAGSAEAGSVHIGSPLGQSRARGVVRSRAIRIDAISVIAAADSAPVIEHLRRVF